MLLALWSLQFQKTGPSPVNNQIGGGFDVKKYRDYLERLNGIKVKEIITPEIAVEIRDISKEVKVSTPRITKVIQNKPIDYFLIDREIRLIQERVLFLMEQAIMLERKRQQDEEIAFLLLVC